MYTNKKYIDLHDYLKKVRKDNEIFKKSTKKLKEENDVFSTTFKKMKNINTFLHNGNSKYQKLKEFESLRDLFSIYKEKGYKIPNLSPEKEIFKIEPLLESDSFRLVEGFNLYPQSKEKNVNYIEKIHTSIEDIINERKGKFIPKKKTNKFRSFSSESLSSFDEKIMNSKLQKKKLKLTKLNGDEKTFSTNDECNQNYQTISSQIYPKEKTTIPALLEDIKNLIKLIEQIRPLQIKPPKRKNISSNTIFSLSPIKPGIESSHYLSQIRKKKNSFLGLTNLNSQNVNKSNNGSPTSRKKKGKICFARTLETDKPHSPNNNLNTLSSNNDIVILSKCHSLHEEEFLEYAYKNLRENKFLTVFQILKIYLIKYKNLNTKELKAFLDNNHFRSGGILYDIEKIKNKLLKNNISEKSKKIYLSVDNDYKHAAQLTKLALSDKELKNLDKKYVKKLSYQDVN